MVADRAPASAGAAIAIGMSAANAATARYENALPIVINPTE
uniref:Uncharacterized protein n=1 Tax=Rhizobium rhizogenes TaxID=359 RepID=A0A7S5DQ88_RHIRH|nr:hypothetical protein pC5.8a_28 [Rhizobium rhizogenes]